MDGYLYKGIIPRYKIHKKVFNLIISCKKIYNEVSPQLVRMAIIKKSINNKCWRKRNPPSL